MIGKLIEMDIIRKRWGDKTAADLTTLKAATYSSKEFEVHVWHFNLDQMSDARVLLSVEENSRAEKFLKLADYNRYVSAHSLLRRVLAKYLGCAPENVTLTAGPHGKPTLCDAEAARRIFFNLSHSENYGVIAVARGREVGVDVEVLRQLDDVTSIAQQIMAPSELAFFRTLAPARSLDAFFDLWTRKEAALKAIGTGFLDDPREIEVGFSRQISVVNSHNSLWTVLSLETNHPAKIAIAVEGNRPDLKVVKQTTTTLVIYENQSEPISFENNC